MSAELPLRWRAQEHEHVERKDDWFWALGIAAVACAITAIIFQDILFAMLIILAASTISMHARKVPEMINFELTNRGLRIGNVLHRFEEFSAFWVEDEHGEPSLILHTMRGFQPQLVVPLGDTPPDAVREVFSEKVHEVPMRESFAHRLVEKLGF